MRPFCWSGQPVLFWRRVSSDADEERAALLSVDWFDFVVEETIYFLSEEILGPPPQMTLPPPFQQPQQ